MNARLVEEREMAAIYSDMEDEVDVFAPPGDVSGDDNLPDMVPADGDTGWDADVSRGGDPPAWTLFPAVGTLPWFNPTAGDNAADLVNNAIATDTDDATPAEEGAVPAPDPLVDRITCTDNYASMIHTAEVMTDDMARIMQIVISGQIEENLYEVAEDLWGDADWVRTHALEFDSRSSEHYGDADDDHGYAYAGEMGQMGEMAMDGESNEMDEESNEMDVEVAGEEDDPEAEIDARKSAIDYYEREGLLAKRLGDDFAQWLKDACYDLVRAESYTEDLMDFSTDVKGTITADLLPEINNVYHALLDHLNAFDGLTKDYKKLVAKVEARPQLKHIIPRTSTTRIPGSTINHDLENHRRIKMERFLCTLDVLQQADLGEEEYCIICRQHPSAPFHELFVRSDHSAHVARLHQLVYGEETVPITIQGAITDEAEEPREFVRVRVNDEDPGQRYMADLDCLETWLMASARCPVSGRVLF